MDPEFADLVPLFVGETRERLDRLAALAPRVAADAAAAAEARRELHTIKGAARMLGMATISDLCHRVEGELQAGGADAGDALARAVDTLAALVGAAAAGEEPPADGPERDAPAAPRSEAVRTPVEVRVDAATLDALAERATRVRLLAVGAGHLSVRLAGLARRAAAGARQPHPERALAEVAAALERLGADLDEGQRRLRRAAERQVETLQSLQVHPLRPFLLSLARHARSLAASLGREVDVLVSGEETRLDRGIAAAIEESLLHLVRNAVDHGIEPPAARRARGKPARGALRIEAAAAGDRVRFTIADDGAGIDRDAVLAAAVAAGLVDASRAGALSEEEVHRLLLVPGFSTRAEVSEVSGRGVGLDVVATATAAIGGDLAIASRRGAGTTVTVTVPAARRGEVVAVLRVGRRRLGLPAQTLRRVTVLGAGAVLERGGRRFARVGDRLVPFVPLADACGEAPAARQVLVEGTAAGQPLAVVADALEGREEVVLRPLTRLAAAGALLDGVALLASGEPVAVLSPAALARAGERPAAAPAAGAQVAPPLRVLLVDDSPVTREMERRLLEDAGFAVAVAPDAVEALAQLAAERFDCLVTDVEMPGMDGYELTRRLRAIPRLAQLPVIVVSTRDRPQDRLRGLEAGADAYLAKQRLDPGELADVVRRLGGRR
jgi:chemotaxis protein histidine kinase CheA